MLWINQISKRCKGVALSAIWRRFINSSNKSDKSKNEKMHKSIAYEFQEDEEEQKVSPTDNEERLDTLSEKLQFIDLENKEAKWSYYTKYKNKLKKESNFSTIDYQIQDIEEIKSKCSRLSVCPYYYQIDRCLDAELILMPYNCLFDDFIFKHYSIDLKDAIVIIDEGHNITQVWEGLACIEINQNNLSLINKELNNLLNKIL